MAAVFLAKIRRVKLTFRMGQVGVVVGPAAAKTDQLILVPDCKDQLIRVRIA